MKPLELARQRVAARYDQPYHKNAILAGEWDKGTIMQKELLTVLDEHATPIETIDE